ncbi:MAG: type I glyceraldehyde-3-phosphate dehydrogenase [Candidatus Woesearchaeota archaeon]|nr:type I glyceraldehyde-3-phosphate dehydrogenase [Candidatus Woesearchaeota archaeon]MDP7182098.1 type I glyceraldehyde-3-phosphate dehydrogenase [Candidatus Woesearchaeota archaeon]MDP7198696.1 type I glyceraldehyde-3-phosphate dehydrogenase [Candidatus Woesearchaeota archaeon]MDP7467670.1 type I glyceraldehyde-3-phosphate dehydrogenase [Candidatus Woesearchaeota archaeon]MDP7647239.1 type I glyceraldehyde-3-phosphate dehydrogenase [Candidatus Woesearchaeota archaeon]
MSMRVAINGFGRIGRLVLQAGVNNENIQWVAVNDLTDTETLAHLFKWDSVFGRFPGTVEFTKDSLVINGKEIVVLSEKDPSKLPWKKLKVDVVVESTGLFKDKQAASQHIKAGAKKVLVSAPMDDADCTIVQGVNEGIYNPKKHHVISNASCTTNALAPLVKVLDDHFKVEKGFMITGHSYTADQKLVDGPHKDLRRARSAAVSIIPTSTGAAKAVGLVLPHLNGKLDGVAWRVPTPDGSIVNLTCTVKKKATIDSINKAFEKAAEHEMHNILEYSDEPLVSRDIVHNPHSSIFDSLSTSVIQNLVSVTSWYDNEWGYSTRMVELLCRLFDK